MGKGIWLLDYARLHQARFARIGLPVANVPLPDVRDRGKNSRSTTQFAALCVLLMGMGTEPGIAEAFEKIAFESDRDGNREIYLMNTDGSNSERLTTSPADDRRPRWSPDGTRILFTSSRDGDYEVYVMDSSGGFNQTNLTDHSFQDGHAEWSPDGNQIVFMSNRDGNFEIYVMNADGSDPTRLTNSPSTDSSPFWSPSGTEIGFQSDRDGNYEIYAMNADGSSQTRLTDDPWFDSAPVWSPDGTQIVFVSWTYEPGEAWRLYVVEPDGSNLKRLPVPHPGVSNYSPAWSPDGSKIALLSSTCCGRDDLFVMDPDGSDPTRLTTDYAIESFPVWSPDGTRIAFASFADAFGSPVPEFDNYEIYVANADGSALLNLTNNSVSNDWDPVWSPSLAESVPAISNKQTIILLALLLASGLGAQRWVSTNRL